MKNLVDKKSHNPAQNAKFGSLGRFSNFNVSMRYSDQFSAGDFTSYN